MLAGRVHEAMHPFAAREHHIVATPNPLQISAGVERQFNMLDVANCGDVLIT
jgi:hypothetical protein